MGIGKRLAGEKAGDFIVVGPNTGAYVVFSSLLGGESLRLPAYANEWTMKNCNFLYQSTFGATRFMYTARDASGIPVRKYFEISASGAVLIAATIKGFDDLGFLHGRHYIKAEPYENADVLASFDGTDET
jgi:hypothetical protein